MNIPDDLRYTEKDEWLRLDGDTAAVGITDYAQDQLSDIVFFETLAATGEELGQGDAFANVESVKAASEIYLPVDGEVSEINESLADAPEAINGAPYESWMVKIKIGDAGQVEALMDAAAYRKYVEEREA